MTSAPIRIDGRTASPADPSRRGDHGITTGLSPDVVAPAVDALPSLDDLAARNVRRERLGWLVLACVTAIALAVLVAAGPADAAIGGW